MIDVAANSPSKNSTFSTTVGYFLHFVLVVVLVVLILLVNRRISKGHSGDFRHFYFAAGALLDHRDPYGDFSLPIVERGLGRKATDDEQEWYTTNSDRYLYPPLIAMLYTPLARVRFDVAERIMVVINALLLYAGILLVTRSFIHRFHVQNATLPLAPLPTWRGRGIDWTSRNPTLIFAIIALLGTLVNVDKIHGDLQMFQTNALMFFLFALSLWWLDRRPLVAGIPLGIIMNIKYLSLATLPWLIIRRRWSTAFSLIVSSVVFALLPAVISGWQENLRNLSVAYTGLAHMVGIQSTSEQANVDDIRDFLSCSITSAMARRQVVPMLVTIDPAKLAARGLSLPLVIREMAIRKIRPTTQTATPAGQVLLLEPANNPLAIGSMRLMPLGPARVPLKDVADIRFEQRSLLLPMLGTAAVAGAAVLIGIWIYRRSNMPVFLWPPASQQMREPYPALVGIEFVSIIAATLCFSPQTNTRHLMLATMITIPLMTLMVTAKTWLTRIATAAVTILITVGFSFPPGGQAPEARRMEIFWFGHGGQCWCLLIAVMTLVAFGVARARDAANATT